MKTTLDTPAEVHRIERTLHKLERRVIRGVARPLERTAVEILRLRLRVPVSPAK